MHFPLKEKQFELFSLERKGSNKTPFSFFFFDQKKMSTKNKQILNSEQEPQDFFSKCLFHHLAA